MATNSSTINISRSAVAGLSIGLNTFGNIVPLAFVENKVGATNPQLLKSANCGNQGLQFTKGCQYTISATKSNKTPNGGEYVILDLSSARSGNGAGLRELLAIGSDGYVTSGQAIPELTNGVDAGKTREGLNTRFDDYQSGLNPATFPPDANIRENITRAQYRNASYFTAPSHTGVWDRRVIIIPIITPDQYNSGIITPTKFGAFFMTSAVSNGQSDIFAEYMGSPAVLGNGGFNPNGGAGTADITTAVLYR